MEDRIQKMPCTTCTNSQLYCFLVFFSSFVICVVFMTLGWSQTIKPSLHMKGLTRYSAKREQQMVNRVLIPRQKEGPSNWTSLKDEKGVVIDADNAEVMGNEKTVDGKGFSRPIVSVHGKSISNRSISDSFLYFEGSVNQQLYLYEKLLRHKWNIDRSNIANFRQELAQFRSELNGSNKIIVYQGNVKAENKSSEDYGKLLKTNPFNNGTRIRSCAVIGNSGILLNSSCGKFIDESDYVFRCNIAPLAPHKKDAGLKSNFTSMNPSLVLYRYKGVRKSEHITAFNKHLSQYSGIVWVPGVYVSVFRRAAKVLEKYNGTTPKIVLGYKSHFSAVQKFWKKQHFKKLTSTGFYLVTTAIQLCDSVELFGFWPFPFRYNDDSLVEVPYHYFDEVDFRKANTSHTMDREFNFIMQLHNKGIVHVNIGGCG